MRRINLIYFLTGFVLPVAAFAGVKFILPKMLPPLCDQIVFVSDNNGYVWKRVDSCVFEAVTPDGNKISVMLMNPREQ